MIKYTLAVIFVLLSVFARAQTVITTFAGSNIYNFFNAAPATTAQLKQPGGIFIGMGGTVYVSDGPNSAIRKFDIATGIMSLYAGNGLLGNSGDGGPATLASLTPIHSITMDGAGNLYLCEGPVVRKVSPTGIITAFAGNGTTTGCSGDGSPATASAVQINAWGVATDPSGNVYISDHQNNVVRKVSPSGIISTFAGSCTPPGGYSGDGGPATAAKLDGPSSLAMDNTGNLYIADERNFCIRKVDVSGNISTVAGNFAAGAGYSGDGGPATAAQLNQVFGLYVDLAGNMYIGETFNNVIRRVDASGVITTIAGNYAAGPGYSGDGGPATAAQLNGPSEIFAAGGGNFFICDAMNNMIRKVNLGSGIITTVAGNTGYTGDNGSATAACLLRPSGVCKDRFGNLLIADPGNHTVRKVNGLGVINTVAGNGFKGSTGDGGPATTAMLIAPVSVAVSKTGDVYLSDSVSHIVRKVSALTGIITTFAGINNTPGHAGDGGAAASALLLRPLGIAFDTADNLFISEFGSNDIRRVDAVTGIITTYAGTGAPGYSGDGGAAVSAQFSNPAYIAFDAMNNLYVTDFNNNVVRKIDAAAGTIATVFGNGTAGDAGDGGTGISAQLDHPLGIAATGGGGIYVAAAGKIRHVPIGGGPVISSAGSVQTGISPDGLPATGSVFSTPTGLTFDTANYLLVADAGNSVVRGFHVSTVGVRELSKTSVLFSIFPNPNTGGFELSGTAGLMDAGGELGISVINVLGIEVYHQAIVVPQNNRIGVKIALDGNIPAGVYTCRITGLATNESLLFLLKR